MKTNEIEQIKKDASKITINMLILVLFVILAAFIISALIGTSTIENLKVENVILEAKIDSFEITTTENMVNYNFILKQNYQLRLDVNHLKSVKGMNNIILPSDTLHRDFIDELEKD